MDFPPDSKKSKSKPASPPPSDNDGDEGGMPPDPMGGMGAAPPDPMGGVCPTCGMSMGGGAPAGPPMDFGPKPGQGMDPMQAMSQGLGPQAMGPPMGPNGFPIGGGPPSPTNYLGGQTSPDMGGSDILQMLLSSGGGDPYAPPPGAPPINDGQPPADPGLAQLLQALAMIQMGVPPQGSPSSGLNDTSMNRVGNSQNIPMGQYV
jgi:hypothetical protein